MLLEEPQHALPGILRCLLVITPPCIVEKRMLCAGIDLDIVRDVVAVEHNVQFLRAWGREILVRVWADNRAEASHGLQGTRIHRVVWRNRSQPIIRAGPGDGETATHAVTNCPDS